MPRPSRVFPILVPLVLAATAVRAADDVPLFDGVSGFGRTVTIASPEAQRYFDQAMAFYWGFHHEEVVRTLEHAAVVEDALGDTESARRRRSIASLRVRPQTTSFATIGS